jgi:hypothetical protein
MAAGKQIPAHHANASTGIQARPYRQDAHSTRNAIGRGPLGSAEGKAAPPATHSVTDCWSKPCSSARNNRKASKECAVGFYADYQPVRAADIAWATPRFRARVNEANRTLKLSHVVTIT